MAVVDWGSGWESFALCLENCREAALSMTLRLSTSEHGLRNIPTERIFCRSLAQSVLCQLRLLYARTLLNVLDDLPQRPGGSLSMSLIFKANSPHPLSSSSFHVSGNSDDQVGMENSILCLNIPKIATAQQNMALFSMLISAAVATRPSKINAAFCFWLADKLKF